MSVDLSTINAQTKALASSSSATKLNSTAFEAKKSLNVKEKSILLDADKKVAGILAVSQGADEVNQTLIDAMESIGEIQGDVPGLETDLVPEIDSTKASKLTLITEENSNSFTENSSIVKGNLNKVVTMSSPQAVADALANTLGKTVAEVQSAVKTLAQGEDQSATSKLDQQVTEGISAASGFLADLNSALGAFANLVGSRTNDLLADIGVKLDRNVINTLREMIDFQDTSLELTLDEAVQLLNNGDYNTLISKGSASRRVDQQTFEAKLNALTLDPAKNIIDTTSSSAVVRKSIPSYTIGSNNNTWSGETTPITQEQFSYIDSYDELEAELRATQRDITEFVAHWSGTYINQDIGAEEIHSWHTDRGFSGCGYHLIIRRDGRLQRGRPLDKRGAHSAAYGHNTYSIGVCLVGGYNCPSNTRNPDKYISGDSINPEQMKTFAMFCKAFYAAFPAGQAYGHVDTSDKGKVDPGFDVQEYVFEKFGKVNVNIDGTKAALSPSQIAAGRGRA